jgi:hypothetical protein
MKKIILLFIFFLCAKSFAQTNGITYQALILNPTEGKVSTATNTNSPLVSKDICMLFKFVDEFSNIEYQEVIRTKTDPYGMVNLIIGTGTQTAGYSTSFEKISWDSVQKNLVVGISFTGDCSSFTEISNQPFSSVPFAYSSINAVNVTGVVALENGGTNATTVLGAKTNLGLENVDNTTDLNKPISNASKLALDLKEDTINKSTNVTTDGNSDIKYPTVKSVKNYVDSSVSFNLSGLTNEISRATLAENTIAANLVTETNRATLAEATNSTAITAETNRASLAEATLTTNLTAEVNRATTAEATKEDAANKSTDGSFTSNSDVKFPTEKATKTYVDASASSNSLALTNEISRATTTENSIAANLVSENERATLAEATNATALTAETNRATLAETTLTTNLNAEVNRATVAEATKEDAANKSTDGSFASNSDVKFPTEKATKTYVDASASSNSLALSNEISRATLAENTIAANLVLETERATLAEATNATAITAETARATTAEATKEDSANKSTDGSFASNSDVKFPTEKATKTYVDATASSSSLALTNEISRATLAENTIAANLVLETERATLAETNNATAINAETNRATLAEATLTTNLTAEVNRATAAEATKEDTANKSTDGSFASNSDVKFPTEKATKTYVDASSSSNSVALNDEISRATLAENAIASNLVTETERATLAEINNATAITAETNRASLAEATLTTNLTAEVNRATTAEATKEDAVNKSTDGSFTSNSDVKFPTEKATKTYVDVTASSSSLALTNEISRATSAENTIVANLVSETERATLAEATLTTNLTAETNRATTTEATKEDTANKSTDGSFTSNSDVKFPTEKATKTYVDASASSNSLALTNEISRATLAENTIAANLVLETERATLAEVTNAIAINAETNRATLAETTNSTAITAETNRATLAETTFTTNLTVEVNRAIAAEATKEDTANKSTDGSFTSNSDVKFPTEKATKTYVDASASSNSLALTNEISRATLAENSIAANLVTETERATLAETNNTTAITAETTRATLAETTLTTNLTAETNRAITAEAIKEDAANKSTDGSFTSNSDVKFPTEKATKTYVDASASSNSLALTNEISRATSAENTIAANLISETERATLAETNNTTAITAETTRASLAEATLTTNLTAEVNRATTAEATKEDTVNKSTDGSFTSNSDVKFPTEKATKTYVDASSSSNSLALTNEISRATTAENAIATNLATETERATLAEAINATAINAETNRATAAEATKEDAANKSTDGSFASNSDVKFPTEKATKNYVDASASSSSLALTNEISRATLAENTIAANLVTETERAILGETSNATAITAETTRATTAEATKEDTVNKSTDGSFASNSDVKFPTEKATKTYVDASASSNSLALTNEISRATLAENTIAANLVAETERASLVETNNTTAITAETTRATLAETTLTTNLTTETNRAITAEATKEDAANKSTDGSFASNSDVKFPTEKATKTYVDATALSNSLALTNEISRATLAENTIAANLVLETERATLAETTLTTNLNAEINRATTAEATKEDAANKSTDGSFASNSDVKFPTEKATKTYVDASTSSNSLALTNEISRATLAENTIATNLVTETERATLAETNNATAITAETNRATLAETTLTTNLTTETNRAITAEATKEDAANKSTDGSFASNSDVKFPTEKATKTYVDATALSNSLALTNEISRATLAENTIAANLVLETERATLAETTLTTNLNAEINRATTAEATKEDAANKSTDGSFASNSDVKFPTEKATKTYVDASTSSNSLALTNEISRATLAENTIAANLVTETERATLAETNNATAITAETNRATTAEATKEDAANKSTDGSFASNSDVKFPTEKATKTYVDASALSSSLALNNEISRATLAENTLTTNLTTEVNRATSAETTKEDTANKSTDGSFTSNSDVKFPTEKATKTYVDATALSNSLALTNEISRATTAENAIAANLVTEKERASLAEATLTTNLTAETNRATTAEATKEDAENKSTDGSFATNSDVKFPTEKATKTYVDASISSNSLALTDEISRATLAENTIASNLVTETERATLAENTLATNLDLKANLASPSFTGTPSLPTGTIAVTQSAENNSTAIATTAFVTAANATNANLTGDVTSIGNLTTIATNVITTTKIADSNITNAKLDKANIPLSGFGVAASAVALGNNKLTDVADPTNPQDAATKNYVDALTSIGVTGNGTTNYIPKFSSSSALANSLIFDSGTQIGIGTNAPTSLFQIGGNGSGDNPLKYDYDGGGNGALKFGFRQYEYRIKSNQNSGVLENLTFSYYNQSTGVDSDRFVIANDGIYIPGKLNVTGTVNGGAATLSSLNVNNSQLNVNSSTNTVGFFTDSPTSKFQIGGDGNFDNPLKYDYGYGSGEGALKFGFRQNEFRIKTNQNSGVLEKLTFSYYKNADGTDIESMHIDNNGVVSITKLAVTAGSPGNGKVLTSDAFGNASWVAPVVASSNEFVDLTTTQTIAGTKTFSSTVTGNSFVKSGGTSAQYLMADGTVSTGAAPVREVADETSAAASQNSFTLTQTPSINSKVKMYVNGIRISNVAYSVSGTTLTYIPANNGSYILSVNDRVQFDYFY